MIVKALCNVIYKGVLYAKDDIFDADEVIPNTVEFAKPAKDNAEDKKPQTTAKKRG